jgi:hypothetical protein
MPAVVQLWIGCVILAWVTLAAAAPSAAPAPHRPAAPAAYRSAVQLVAAGKYQQALSAIDDGLAAAPTDLSLLGLKGSVLSELDDLAGALAAYEAYRDNAVGAKRRRVLTIIDTLLPVKTTALEVALANGPADVYYVKARSKRRLCSPTPPCRKPMLPGDYTVIAERPGFERWTAAVTLQDGATARLAVALREKPSPLVVRVAQPGARVMVDGAGYAGPASIAAGSHRVIVSLAGHADAQLELSAHEGKPIELDLTLTPIVPVRTTPRDARLVVDGQPTRAVAGGLALSPGPHVVIVRAPGYRDRRLEIAAVRAPDYEIAVELAALRPPLAPAGAMTGQRKVALAIAGLGLAAAAGGTVLGLRAQRADRDTYALCHSPANPCASAATANQLNQLARSRALAANVAFGAAGSAAIGAAVLWFTGTHGRFAVTPRLDRDAGLALSGRF